MNRRNFKRGLIVALAAIMLLLNALTCVASAVEESIEGITMKMVKPTIELCVGESDKLLVEFEGTDLEIRPTFWSDDSSVVGVDGDGTVHAKKLGTATITATSLYLDQSVTCCIEVVEKKFSFDDNILLSVFWPPMPEYINDEQYKLMADAGINWIGLGDPALANPECQYKMLELCDKYGIGMTVFDSTFGHSLIDKTAEEIAAEVARYNNVPGAYGFALVDEPFNPNHYIDAYVALKDAAPDAYMHLNFFPVDPYKTSDQYQAQMNDWCRLAAAAGYPQEYLMFDKYPFPLAGEMNRAGYFANARMCYEVGLENDVKTGLYIQTVCQEVAFRRPDDDEIRYEMYASLAFGFKQLSFFTWFTPVERGEPFADGIIDPDGTPNEHYGAVKTINNEILNIGPTLVKCDALGIYFNGPDTYGQPAVPADFFVQGDEDDSVILSWMRHKETGRNYLMVVNNDYDNAQDVSLTFDGAITSLAEVSRTDGSLVPLSMKGNTLDMTLAAGDAMLIALPEGYDYYEAPVGQPDASVNLAHDAMILAPDSVGEDGWYISAMQDGQRGEYGTGSTLVGWKSPVDQPSYVDIDLRRELSFNRVDLYTAGNMRAYGAAECGQLQISVSDDGENWRAVKTLSNPNLADPVTLQVTFEEQTARYIRVSFDRAAFHEIEVYCDDGSVPAPDLWYTHGVITYEEGENIALGKTAFCYAAKTGHRIGLDYINDGENKWIYMSTTGGWTGAEERLELVGVDFGDLFAVDKIVLVDGGAFPVDFRVELSADGVNWTLVKEVTDAEDKRNGAEFEIKLDTPVNARLVRVTATKFIEGMFTLAELEAYGTPVCDKTVLEKAVNVYAYKDGDTSNALYVEASAALENASLTQTQADDYASRLLALVGLTVDNMPDVPKTPDEPATEPVETTPVTDAPATEEAITTTPATSADVTTEAKGGCGSVIGMSAVAVVAAASAVAVCRRRRRDEED